MLGDGVRDALHVILPASQAADSNFEFHEPVRLTPGEIDKICSRKPGFDLATPAAEIIRGLEMLGFGARSGDSLVISAELATMLYEESDVEMIEDLLAKTRVAESDELTQRLGKIRDSLIKRTQ